MNDQECGEWASPLIPGVTLQIMLVTPNIAMDWMDRMGKQRPLSQDVKERYAADMTAGHWQFLGDPIRFDVTGECRDGQHRLKAIIESGAPQVCLVIFGLPVGAAIAFDQGKKRTFAQNLGLRGYINANVLASVTCRMWHWTHGNYGQARVARVINAPYLRVPPSPNALDLTLATWPEVVTAARHAGRLYNQIPKIPRSIIGVAWTLLGIADIDAREKFFHELATRRYSRPGPEYPIEVLRQLGMMGSPRINGARGEEKWQYLAYIFEAWNVWMDGGSISRLKLRKPLGPATLPHPRSLPTHLATTPAERERTMEVQADAG